MKTKQQVLGARDIKNVHSVGAHSIPRVQRSSYLELYTLRRERDRLESEMLALDKRRNTARRQLDCINKRMERLQEETQNEQRVKTDQSVPAKPLKRMAVTY